MFETIDLNHSAGDGLAEAVSDALQPPGSTTTTVAADASVINLSDGSGTIRGGGGGGGGVATAAAAGNATESKSPSAPLTLYDRCNNTDLAVDAKLSGDLILSNIDFSYATRPDQKVLDNFSVTIQSGSLTCFVGKSGAGKSTLANLLCGLYIPEKGRILVGDVTMVSAADHLQRKISSRNIISKMMSQSRSHSDLPATTTVVTSCNPSPAKDAPALHTEDKDSPTSENNSNSSNNDTTRNYPVAKPVGLGAAGAAGAAGTGAAIGDVGRYWDASVSIASAVRWLRRNVGVAQQSDSLLLSGTIAENIEYGKV